MPYQNRVDPFGQLNAVKDRGAWMGNRGILHDERRQIVAQWRLKRWIICVLNFKDRHRQVFTPHRYTELFFLDEATALSAGHRPCAECQRERYNEFCQAWSEANPKLSNARVLRAEDIDRQLHVERAHRGGGKRSHHAELFTLPSGTFIDRGGLAYLVWNGELLPWGFGGYGPSIAIQRNEMVRVLTPLSIVSTLRANFNPQVHESAVRRHMAG